MENLSVTVSKTSKWQRSIELKIPREEVESEEKRLFKVYRKKIRVDGFRKGKVPENIVLKRYGDDIRAEAVETILPRAMTKALEDNDISPLAPPTVEDLEYGESGPLKVKATVEIMPEFEVKGYKNLKLEKPVRDVEEEDVDEALEGLRDRTAELIPVERSAEPGDYLIADILECDAGGTPIIGNRSENRTLHVAEEGDGAEVGRQLVGVEKGMDRRITVEDKVFLVQVKEIKEKKLPVLDDEYAQALGDFENLNDLRAKVKEDLKEHVEAEARRFMASQAIEKLIQKNSIEVPESLIQRYLAGVVADHKEAAGDTPIDEEAIRQQYREIARMQMQWQLVQMRIIDQEGIEVADEEVRERVNRMAENYGIESKEAYKVLSGQGRIDRIRGDIREEKVINLILDGAKIKEKKVPRKERRVPETKEPAQRSSGIITTDISGPVNAGESTFSADSADSPAEEGKGPGEGGSGLIIPGR